MELPAFSWRFSTTIDAFNVINKRLAIPLADKIFIKQLAKLKMELLQQLLYAAVGTAALLWFCVRQSLRYWAKRGILHEPPKFISGHLKHVFHKVHIASVLEQHYNKYQGKAPFIGFYAYLQPMVLVLDLDLIDCILTRYASLFAERKLYHNEQADPLSINLMQLDSQQWHTLRYKLQPCFSANRLPQLLPTLLRVADAFKRSLQQKKLEHKEYLLINDLVDCWNIDVISSMVFGLEGDGLREQPTKFSQMAHNCWSQFGLFRGFLAFSCPSLLRLFRFKCYNEEATAYFKQLISKKMFERAYSRLEYNDYLQLFINAKQDGNTCLTQKQIVAQAFSFIACGLEACNATLTFCLYELAFAPSVQQQARDEIQKILNEHRNELTMEALQEMKYLKQILYETWRLHPPHAFLLRNTSADYEIPNSVFMLREGQRIIIPVSAIHRDARFYSEPLKFEPMRFEAAEQKKRHPMTFLPFGAWPRECPARHFVETQLLVCLSLLLRHYKFSVCKNTCQKLEYDATQLLLKPKEQIMLRVEHLKID